MSEHVLILLALHQIVGDLMWKGMIFLISSVTVHIQMVVVHIQMVVLEIVLKHVTECAACIHVLLCFFLEAYA